MEQQIVLIAMDREQLSAFFREVVREVIKEELQSASCIPPAYHAPESFLSVSEICTLFKISKPTLYQWIRSGNLKSVKISSRRFFLYSEVRKMVTAKTTV